MRKLILSCMAIVAIATSIKAQNPQVQVSATVKNYSVTNTPGYTYVWSLNAAGTTAAPSFSNSGINSQNIIWSVAQNNVTLTITPSSGACPGTPSSLTFDVVNTLTYAVEVQTAPVDVCSGDVPSATFRLNGYTSGSWNFRYKIDNGSTIYTTTTSASAATGFIPTFDVAAGIANATAAPVPHTINIISWNVNGLDYVPASPVNVTYNTSPIPTVGTITVQ